MLRSPSMRDRWEIAVFYRTFLACVLSALFLVLVTASSDEGGLSALTRGSRVVPVLPLAVGATVALLASREHAKQDLRAWRSLGISNAHRAWIWAGVAFATILACVVAWLPELALEFYPSVKYQGWSGAGDQFSLPTLGISYNTTTANWTHTTPTYAAILEGANRTTIRQWVIPSVLWLSTIAFAVGGAQRKKVLLAAAAMFLVSTLVASQLVGARILTNDTWLILPAVLYFAYTVWHETRLQRVR